MTDETKGAQAPTPGPLSGEAMRDMVWSWLREPDAARIAIRFNWGDATSLGAFLSERLAPTAPVETLGEMAAFWGNVVTGAGGAETLHPATADLVDRFAAELKSKLAKAEAKYGYLDDWSKPDWKDDLIESLAEHVQKGDPRDVAAYCAFAWHHGWSTSEVPDCFHRAPRHTDVVQALEPFAKAARMAGINSHNKPNLEQEAKRAVSWLDFSRAAKAIELSATQPNTAPVEASGSERESEAWEWLGQLYPNDAPSDLAYDANEMIDAFLAGSGRSDRMAKALERIAGEQQYRSGYCQTDITVEPALTAEEAQTVAREALAQQTAPRPQPSGETREAEQMALNIICDPGIITGLHTAAEARDWIEKSVRAALLSKKKPTSEEVDARRRLINLIEQWDGESEYDAEDCASLADDILHAFNGSPVLSSSALGYVSADAEAALKAGINRVIYPAPSAHASFPLYAAPVPAQDDDKLRIAVEEALADVEYVPGDHPIVPVKHDRFVKAIRHALKSTAAQEGGEL